MSFNNWFFILVFLISCSVYGQQSEVWIHPNKGQWEDEILYMVELNQGAMFIEKDGFTYALNNFSKHHDHDHPEKTSENEKNKFHTVKTKFKNSNWKGSVEEKDTSIFYRNYFLGKDSSQWAPKVHSFKYLRLEDFYPLVDLIIEAREGGIKYSFEVAPGGDVSQIELIHHGADSVYLVNQDIHIATRFGPIVEKELLVWNEDANGRQQNVKTNFTVQDKVVRFEFPEDYDTTKRLIIDPQLTFSSFTGAASDNWGFTAAPDLDANLFGGGIVIGTSYPTSTGAYDQTFNGGEGALSFDIGISKFSAQGNSLLYSTFIGGTRNETPNSIVSNDAGELFVLGVTSSINFPMAGTPFQNTFQGGTNTNQNGLQFSGTDIVLFKLNVDGTNLLASTYFGGSGNDGLNLGTLHYNYGDQFRGEIIVNGNNVYIASSTRSTNFPTPNGWKNTISGSQDAIVAKFTDDLTTVEWSTYFGGSNLETGNALQISSTGNVFMSGGTNSNNIGVPDGGHLGNFQGGLADGYVVEFDAATSTPVNGTYIGTAGYDQSYFVQLDVDDNVYVFGQTNGNMPISGGVYSNPNSGQFIQKYDPTLSTVDWTTRVGGGNNTIEISPTAFLVSDCGEIYYAGWGGQTNHSSQAVNSTTNGFPVTSDAFQQTTTGNNFYVAVLDDNASALNYASYMGGTTSSANHVDGGTSRFDKKGRIYHAVCGACGGNANGFTTTPGVVSTTNNSGNCNMAVFKFDLGIIESSVSAPSPFVCIPDPVQFDNDSENANEFFWDFGDGNTSTDFEPEHNYTVPGTYTVILYASDTSGCFEGDSSIIEITIGLYEGAISDPTAPICPGEPYELEASGGTTYAWSPAQYLDDSTSSTPIATIYEDTEFTVIINDSCGTDTLSILLEVYGSDAETIEDQIICLGDTTNIWATGGGTYEWNPADSIIGSNTLSEITVSPSSNITYSVNITTPEGCELSQEVFIEVFDDEPIPVLDDSVIVCLGDAITLNASGGFTYEWLPDEFLNTNIGPTVIASPTEDITYVVGFSNPCGTIYDSIFVETIEVTPIAGQDTTVCPGETVYLWAEGGVSYQWTPPNNVANPNSASTSAQPPLPLVYEVLVTDEYGCSATETVTIEHFPLPNVIVQSDYYAFEGDEVEITANGNQPAGTYSWEPEELLDCSDCQSPTAYPIETTTFNVFYVDGNGCEAEGETTINLDGIIYVPNTFTPDGDGHNDDFYPRGGNIKEYHMIIFNRWGEVMFESHNFNGKWDGTYGGEKCKDGTYVWKITYIDISNNKKEIVGHVNLLK